MVAPAVRGVEHVLLELRLELRELEHHGLEALLARWLQANASESEITQRVLEESTLNGSQRGPLLLRDSPVRAVQRLALREIGLVGRKEREARVVTDSERLRVQDGVEMAHRRPGSGHAVLQLLERLDDGGECGVRERFDLADPGSPALQQLAHAGLDVLGADLRERGQGVLAQQRVFHVFLVLGGVSIVPIPAVCARSERVARRRAGPM